MPVATDDNSHALTSEIYRRIDAQNHALDELMRACSAENFALEPFCRRLTEIAANHLRVERASVWRFRESGEAMDCLDLFVRSNNAHSSEDPLFFKYFPQYFSDLTSARIIDAVDGAEDPRTSAFKDVYLAPNNIVSLIDATIRCAAGARGVVCIESVGERRDWTPAEKSFAASLADLLGFAMDRLDREEVIRRLQATNQSLRESEALFSDLAAQTPGAIFQYFLFQDGREHISFMSAGCEEIYELKNEEIVGDPAQLWAMALPEDLPGLKSSIIESWSQLTPWSYRWRIDAPSGRRKWLQGQAHPTRLPDGGVRWNCLVLDVTEQMLREEELARTREIAETTKRRLVDAIEALPDAFVMYDQDDRLVICNDQYRRVYAQSAHAIEPGARFEDIIRAGVANGQYPQAAGREEEWIQARLKEHKNPTGSIDQELPGDRHLQIHESRTAGGDLVGVRVDVTDLKRQQRRLAEMAEALKTARNKAEHEALHDALTELPNRRHLDQQLASIQSWADATFFAESEIYLLHVDLDRFKQINDTLGHAAGDAVLRHAAETLRKSVRSGDFVARVGGDEFVILCRDVDCETEIDAVAQRLVTALSAPMTLEDGQTCRLSASVGVASAPAHKASELLVNADIALYRAKNNGRSCVVAFTEDLQHELNAKKQTADDILRGLEADEFDAVFQPQFDAQSGECVGVEALARWDHPERGWLAPDAFLGVAEELNVVREIDRAIFRKAMALGDAFAAAGVHIPKIAVNLSLQRLLDPEILGDVQRLRPMRMAVAFELLETVYFDDERSEVSEAIERLRRVGVEIEIDDFGSGRASVIGLLKIRPDRLKIDRKLVMPITESARHRSLVEAIVQMGRSQGITATAEGVETAEHAQVLRAIGCHAMQGYYFARPMPAPELKSFLAERAWPQAS